MAKKNSNRRQDKWKKAALKAAAQGAAANQKAMTTVLNPAPELDLRPKTKWFLVFTSPRAESRAMAGLQEAGCSVFWPSEHKTVTVGKRTTFDADIATFPRYLFASGALLSEQDQDEAKPTRRLVVKGKPIGSVFDIDGVQAIVSDSNGWVRVPNSALRAIADYQNGIDAPKPEKPRAAFGRGDAATIIEGPFVHLQATIVDCIGLHEAKVLIDAFGRSVAATLPAKSLRAA
jgi:transcription antitermination factor NusG